jgi:hypothetical protein
MKRTRSKKSRDTVPLKSSHRMGGGPNSLKISAPLHLTFNKDLPNETTNPSCWKVPLELISNLQRVDPSDRIPIAIRLSNSYRNIRLKYLSDFSYRNSDSPIAIEIAEIYRTKHGEFLLFFTSFFTNFSPFGQKIILS